jgi:hypothetical protein
MEKVLEPGYQNWEQYVEALCDNFGALFPDIPNILLDKTFQKLMVTPVEGDCCPQPRYRCSLLQQKAWDTGSESKRGLCFFCQKPFRMGRPANASWNDEKEDFLNNWLDSFFSKFLMLPAEASTKAAHVAVLLLLAGNCGGSPRIRLHFRKILFLKFSVLQRWEVLPSRNASHTLPKMRLTSHSFLES